jgi:hypothetical protein
MDCKQKKSKQYVFVVFVLLILYLAVNLWYFYRYIDLVYLGTVIFCFIKFLRIKNFN